MLCSCRHAGNQALLLAGKTAIAHIQHVSQLVSTKARPFCLLRQRSRRRQVVLQASNNEAPPGDAAVPTAQDGVDWFCYTTLGLLFLTDFTPVGQLLTSSGSSAPSYLAAFQWVVFVLPTANWARQRGWDLKRTFGLQAAPPQWLLAGTLGGPVLWLLVTSAINAKAGLQGDLPTVGLDSSVLGGLVGPAMPSSLQQWLLLVLTTAVSPAVAEELLFRGFLLTALQSRFGRIDAVALSAALFAAVHLSLEQFFAFCVLGGAAGAVATGAGSSSVLPAMLLHCTYNLTAIAAGVAAGGVP